MCQAGRVWMDRLRCMTTVVWLMCCTAGALLLPCTDRPRAQQQRAADALHSWQVEAGDTQACPATRHAPCSAPDLLLPHVDGQVHTHTALHSM